MIAQITIDERDIRQALAHRPQPKDWQDFIAFMAEHLPEALNGHVDDEIRYLADLYLDQQECPHRRITTFTTGGWHYTAGEVWDDLREVAVCLDCGRTLEGR